MAMPNLPIGAKTKYRTAASVALSDESSVANRRTSGQDKKSVVDISKVKKAKIDALAKSKTMIRMPTNKEQEFCETIAYDEHMDHGIPQTLLDGLGFHPDANGSNDDDEERISEQLGHNSSKDMESAMLAARAQVPPYSSPSSISKKSRQGKRSKPQPYPTTNINNDQFASQSTLRLSPNDSDIYQSNNLPIDLSQRSSQMNSTPFSPVRPGTNLPRGNVQYAHNPQGYVVARIVRDAPKPARRRSRARNSESADPNPLQIAEGCPFDENNVEEVLGELMEHTEGMRRKMASMKDDMRRVCGTGGSLRTKEQQNKGVEVSQRLQKAYMSYTMALEGIERWDETRGDEERADGGAS